MADERWQQKLGDDRRGRASSSHRGKSSTTDASEQVPGPDPRRPATGAGGGIGRAICLALAEQGWRVAACDLGAGALATAEMVRERGGEALV
jgi:hypothetical protein